jgi:hypothetical protein
MKTKDQTSNKTASTKAITPANSKKYDPQDHAKNLVAQLRQNGALFLSNGAETFMVLDQKVFRVDFCTIVDLDTFLDSRKYIDATSKNSNAFWGHFLDEIENNESVLIQARLWELGEKQACADATCTVSLSTPDTEETILDIVERFGDKLAKQG